VADDDIRGLLGSVQDYFVRGGLDEDARYVLGPHAYEGLSKFASLADFIGPGADVKDVASESAKVMEGDPAAFVGLPAALAMMALPGSKSGVEEVVEKTSEAISPVRRVVEDLPQKVQTDLPKQPVSKSSVYGYHGTVGQREGDEFFDINFARPQDQFLGEGFYFTIDPKVAEEYANIRAIKDLEDIPSSVASRAGLPKGAMRTPQGNIVTTDSMMKGVDVKGNAIAAGQNIARFDLGGIKKPYVVKSNKDRLWAKENINKLKEDGYDSILFDDFKDRSKQIMVFPEYIDTIKSMRTGGLVQRNPYNYEPKAI
jgi:hypothetical protein